MLETLCCRNENAGHDTASKREFHVLISQSVDSNERCIVTMSRVSILLIFYFGIVPDMANVMSRRTLNNINERIRGSIALL